MHFTRRLSLKHHPTGDHFTLAVPREIAQVLGLQDGGGLVSIELDCTNRTSTKKGHSVLKAYLDSDFAWREKFDPTHPKVFRPVAISPRTLGLSKPWGSGKVLDLKEELKDARAIIRCLRAAFPHRRGRKRRRRM
jgi:hypothetical protein